MSYLIIKKVKVSDDVTLPVVLLDQLGEVKEYIYKEQAEEMAKLFQENSDSGHEYRVKKVGSSGE